MIITGEILHHRQHRERETEVRLLDTKLWISAPRSKLKILCESLVPVATYRAQ